MQSAAAVDAASLDDWQVVTLAPFGDPPIQQHLNHLVHREGPA